MIESLHKSTSWLLSFFAGCAFLVGFILDFMLTQVLLGTTTADQTISRIERGAAATAFWIAVTCGVFVCVCAYALYRVLCKGATLLLLARVLYIFSFIALIAAISAAIFFILFRI